MRVIRPRRIWLTTAISGASVCASVCLMLGEQAVAQHPHGQAATPPARQPEPSALTTLRGRFDELLARTHTGKRKLPGAKRKAEMFEEFLIWPRNPFRIEVPVTRTWTGGGEGEPIGTITVGNTEITVAGRKEVGLLLKPNLRGLAPGLYAFHVHENPACGPAIKDGQMVPGLAAGSHLWLSGTGDKSGTTFTSHLGDLPDLEVDADGVARKEIVAARLTLADVVNRALIIHASQDDNSPRLACAPLK
jgi:superoxide dismutase, Cu-Zn family